MNYEISQEEHIQKWYWNCPRSNEQFIGAKLWELVERVGSYMKGNNIAGDAEAMIRERTVQVLVRANDLRYLRPINPSFEERFLNHYTGKTNHKTHVEAVFVEQGLAERNAAICAECRWNKQVKVDPAAAISEDSILSQLSDSGRVTEQDEKLGTCVINPTRNVPCKALCWLNPMIVTDLVSDEELCRIKKSVPSCWKLSYAEMWEATIGRQQPDAGG